jgi:hypothetical protein
VSAAAGCRNAPFGCVDAFTDGPLLVAMTSVHDEFELSRTAGGAPAPTLQPRDPIHCPVLHCRLAAEVCVRRQLARWPGLNRTEDGWKAKDAGLFEFCGTGRCRHGREVRRALPAGWEPAPLPGLRRDIHAQWVALRRWERERLPLLPDIDHPPAEDAAPRVELGSGEPFGLAEAGGRP